MEKLSLVATWCEPFFLQGEKLSYVILITGSGDLMQDEVNKAKYVFSEPTGKMDCAEYMFAVFSKNNFSKSMTSISGWMNIPTGMQ